MIFTAEQLNSLIVSHAQRGDFDTSAVYQKMLQKLKEGNDSVFRTVAPYPCQFDGVLVSWKEGQGWKGENESFNNYCTNPKGHVPEEQYL